MTKMERNSQGTSIQRLIRGPSGRAVAKVNSSAENGFSGKCWIQREVASGESSQFLLRLEKLWEGCPY